MAEEKMAGTEAWRYEHPAEHPDNKPPVTIVAQPSEEATKAYEDAVNAELEKTQPAEAGEPRAAKSEPVDYEAQTVDELKGLAAERGIEVHWDARKADLVKALEKHDKKG